MKNARWILMTEKLPQKGELVLCQGEKGGLFLGQFYGFYENSIKQYASVPNARNGRYAIAWMELPEPLKII